MTGEGGASRKFLIKEEGHLLFTWPGGWGGGNLRYYYLEHIFPSPLYRNKDGSLTHFKENRCGHVISQTAEFLFLETIMRFWVMSKQQLFPKFKKKPQLSFLTLSEDLISQCSFSLSSLNPAADNTFLHSLTTETKHISFPIKTTLFIKSQALSVNDCNMQLW